MVNSGWMQRMVGRARNALALPPEVKPDTSKLLEWVEAGDAMADLVKHPKWHRYQAELDAAYNLAVAAMRTATVADFQGVQAKLNAIEEIRRIPEALEERGRAAKEQLEEMQMLGSLNRIGDE